MFHRVLLVFLILFTTSYASDHAGDEGDYKSFEKPKSAKPTPQVEEWEDWVNVDAAPTTASKPLDEAKLSASTDIPSAEPVTNAAIKDTALAKADKPASAPANTDEASQRFRVEAAPTPPQANTAPSANSASLLSPTALAMGLTASLSEGKRSTNALTRNEAAILLSHLDAALAKDAALAMGLTPPPPEGKRSAPKTATVGQSVGSATHASGLTTSPIKSQRPWDDGDRKMAANAETLNDAGLPKQSVGNRVLVRDSILRTNADTVRSLAQYLAKMGMDLAISSEGELSAISPQGELPIFRYQSLKTSKPPLKSLADQHTYFSLSIWNGPHYDHCLNYNFHMQYIPELSAVFETLFHALPSHVVARYHVELHSFIDEFTDMREKRLLTMERLSRFCLRQTFLIDHEVLTDPQLRSRLGPPLEDLATGDKWKKFDSYDTIFGVGKPHPPKLFGIYLSEQEVPRESPFAGLDILLPIKGARGADPLPKRFLNQFQRLCAGQDAPTVALATPKEEKWPANLNRVTPPTVAVSDVHWRFSAPQPKSRTIKLSHTDEAEAPAPRLTSHVNLSFMPGTPQSQLAWWLRVSDILAQRHPGERDQPTNYNSIHIPELCEKLFELFAFTHTADYDESATAQSERLMLSERFWHEAVDIFRRGDLTMHTFKLLNLRQLFLTDRTLPDEPLNFELHPQQLLLKNDEWQHLSHYHGLPGFMHSSEFFPTSIIYAQGTISHKIHADALLAGEKPLGVAIFPASRVTDVYGGVMRFRPLFFLMELARSSMLQAYMPYWDELRHSLHEVVERQDLTPQEFQAALFVLFRMFEPPRFESLIAQTQQNGEWRSRHQLLASSLRQHVPDAIALATNVTTIQLGNLGRQYYEKWPSKKDTVSIGWAEGHEPTRVARNLVKTPVRMWNKESSWHFAGWYHVEIAETDSPYAVARLTHHEHPDGALHPLKDPNHYQVLSYAYSANFLLGDLRRIIDELRPITVKRMTDGSKLTEQEFYGLWPHLAQEHVREEDIGVTLKHLFDEFLRHF